MTPKHWSLAQWVDDQGLSRAAGPTVRVALLLGFGVTLGIWLFTGYFFTRRVADVETRSAAINTRYVHAQELLSTARAQILLGSVYIRDALLDPDPSTAQDYRRRLDETCDAADRALNEYVPVLDLDAERTRVEGLRREIADFRSTMVRVLATDSHQWPQDARYLIRSQVVPKRELVIRVSEEVQALNRSAFVHEQADVADIYGAAQRRMWETLGVGLAASFGVGLLAVMYAGGLEDRLRKQRARDVQNTRDLQQLSAKLITAQEEERRSIARELHDEVGQVLTAIKVDLAIAQRTIDSVGGPPRLLDDTRSMTDGALATVRDLSHLLHPSVLDDLGLPAAIEWYSRGFGTRHRISVDVLHEHMDQRLTPDIELAVYRIVQETLTNVAKHARAQSCRVYLQRLPTTVLVTVEDDGLGFEASGTSQNGERPGLGLIGIRERVVELGGTMRIDSTRNKGTRVTVELPARRRAASSEANAADESSVVAVASLGAVRDG